MLRRLLLSFFVLNKSSRQVYFPNKSPCSPVCTNQFLFHTHQHFFSSRT